MSATVITPVVPVVGGVANGGADGIGAAATVTQGDKFLNDGTQQLTVQNHSNASITVTITTPATATDGLAIENPAYTIPANRDYTFPFFKPGTYNDSSGYVTLVCSSVTTVYVKVVTCTPL